jgi:hypothetical protein
MLAYPSSEDLMSRIRHGGIVNCPITAHDGARAIEIYGPEVGSLKEKLKGKRQ